MKCLSEWDWVSVWVNKWWWQQVNREICVFILIANIASTRYTLNESHYFCELHHKFFIYFNSTFILNFVCWILKIDALFFFFLYLSCTWNGILLMVQGVYIPEGERMIEEELTSSVDAVIFVRLFVILLTNFLFICLSICLSLCPSVC